jgi:ribosome-associated toxin RatA of RatAB toxin-antitoxin module
MADQTSSTILIQAPPSTVMQVIADFPAYPEWAQGLHVAEVRDTFPDGRAKQVYFEIAEGPIKDSYTLAYDWNGDESVDWDLVSGKMMKKLEGAYLLTARGDATEVTYRLAVELSIPMIGMLRRRAEKVIIDSALNGLKKRAESLA